MIPFWQGQPTFRPANLARRHDRETAQVLHLLCAFTHRRPTSPLAHYSI